MAESKKDIKQEIATVARDITQNVFGGVLLNTDDTLATRGRGKGLKIYDELERDCHAYAVIQKRKMAVISRPWDVTPASDKSIDKQAAELIRTAIAGLQFDRICLEQLDALLKGYAVGEVMWGIRDGMILPLDVIPRDQRRFTFDESRRLRLLTREQPIQGEEVPDRKFIVHTFGGKDGSPYGLGLGSKLFWPVFFKRQDITFWLTFADKFGSPTAVGKYPNGAGLPEQKKLLDALAAIAQDAGVIVPEGMVIELLEAARNGSADLYERLARYMDEQISEAVLGETMTTSAAGAGLGSNQADVHNDVREELSEADADLLSDTLNNTLVRWTIEYNMPGAGQPKLYRNFDEAEDLKSRAERDRILYGMGRELDDATFTEIYGPGYVRKAPPAPTKPVIPAQDGIQDAAFAEAAASTLADNLDAETATAWNAVLAHIESLVENAASLEALQAALTEAYGGLPLDDLRAVMETAFAVAQLAGMADVQAGN